MAENIGLENNISRVKWKFIEVLSIKFQQNLWK
jgi:hypothetical protein